MRSAPDFVTALEVADVTRANGSDMKANLTSFLALSILVSALAGASAPADARPRYVVYGAYAVGPPSGPPGWFQYSVGIGPYAYGVSRQGRSGYGYYGYGPRSYSASGYGPFFSTGPWWDLMDRQGSSGGSP